MMDKKIAGLVGAVAGVATMGATAQAMPAQTQNATASDPLAAASYADLLAPVPNALAALEADNAARAQAVKVDGVQLARYYHHHHHRYHHHHHHHHRYYHHHHHHSYWWYRRHHYYHHHHHHHHGAFFGVPGFGIVVHDH
jgi:hypothetical protein